MAPVQLHLANEKRTSPNEFKLNDVSKNGTCTVCGKIKPNDIVDLSANEIMKETLMNYYKMTKLQVSDTLSSLCVQCVYKINIQREMARTLELRLHQRSNNFHSILKKELIRTPKLRSSRRLLHQKTSPNHCPESNSNLVPETKIKRKAKSLITTKVEHRDLPPFEEISKPIEETKNKSLGIEENQKVLPSKSKSLEEIENEANTSILEILRERPESALLTESGHFIGSYNLANIPNKYMCSSCGKPYWRKDYYKKHIRRCNARHPYAKFGTSNMTDKQYDGSYRPTKARSERIYYCGYCDVTKSTLLELRDHQETHLPHFQCPNCREIFNTKFSYEFHIAECFSKKDVLEANDDEESPRKDRRRTRSVSRALSRVPPSDLETCTIADDIEDDAISIADSTYTQRMHITSDWIEALDEPQDWEINQNSNFDEQFSEELTFSSFKEYDLYLLDIFKLQVECSFFRCLENGCDYRAYELLDAILHDYKEHWNHSWFFCRKCGCMFTRKVHLDYHLYHQNSGRYICFKCTEVFMFQHELDRHLLQHSQYPNFRCNYCQLEFLTEHELLYHCDMEQHDPNKEKPLVHIHQSLTISNNTQGSPDKYGQKNSTSSPMCHNIRIIEMHLPKIPSKHSSFQNNRHIIGDFEFKNQIIPNCAGWKYEED